MHIWVIRDVWPRKPFLLGFAAPFCIEFWCFWVIFWVHFPLLSWLEMPKKSKSRSLLIVSFLLRKKSDLPASQMVICFLSVPTKLLRVSENQVLLTSFVQPKHTFSTFIFGKFIFTNGFCKITHFRLLLLLLFDLLKVVFGVAHSGAPKKSRIMSAFDVGPKIFKMADADFSMGSFVRDFY